MDVVVPVFGSLSFLTQAIDSLSSTVPDIRWRLTIVDDASPNLEEMQNYYRTLSSNGNVRVVYHKENQGFGLSCNDGVKRGKARLILLMNSDIVLHTGCIEAMMYELHDLNNVGVVGAKLIFPENTPWGPPGKIQHAGLGFNADGMPFHVHIGWSPDNPKVNEKKKLQAVTGALLMTRRDLWTKIGGFSPVYGLGTFEEIEYCIAARGYGFSVIYQPEAVATHHVGASRGQGNPAFPLKRNSDIFRARAGHMVLWDEPLVWLALLGFIPKVANLWIG